SEQSSTESNLALALAESQSGNVICLRTTTSTLNIISDRCPLTKSEMEFHTRTQLKIRRNFPHGVVVFVCSFRRPRPINPATSPLRVLFAKARRECIWPLGRSAKSRCQQER